MQEWATPPSTNHKAVSKQKDQRLDGPRSRTESGQLNRKIQSRTQSTFPTSLLSETFFQSFFFFFFAWLYKRVLKEDPPKRYSGRLERVGIFRVNDDTGYADKQTRLNARA